MEPLDIYLKASHNPSKYGFHNPRGNIRSKPLICMVSDPSLLPVLHSINIHKHVREST